MKQTGSTMAVAVAIPIVTKQLDVGSPYGTNTMSRQLLPVHVWYYVIVIGVIGVIVIITKRIHGVNTNLLDVVYTLDMSATQ
jgi:hypothetical protein